MRKHQSKKRLPRKKRQRRKLQRRKLPKQPRQKKQSRSQRLRPLLRPNRPLRLNRRLMPSLQKFPRQRKSPRRHQKRNLKRSPNQLQTLSLPPLLLTTRKMTKLPSNHSHQLMPSQRKMPRSRRRTLLKLQSKPQSQLPLSHPPPAPLSSLLPLRPRNQLSNQRVNQPRPNSRLPLVLQLATTSHRMPET